MNQQEFVSSLDFWDLLGFWCGFEYLCGTNVNFVSKADDLLEATLTLIPRFMLLIGSCLHILPGESWYFLNLILYYLSLCYHYKLVCVDYCIIVGLLLTVSTNSFPVGSSGARVEWEDGFRFLILERCSMCAFGEKPIRK